MRYIIFSFSLFSALFFSSNSFSAIGCRVTTGLYPGVYHTVSSGTSYTCAYYGTLSQCRAGQSGSNSYASVTSSSPGTACRACSDQFTGTLVNYDRLFCPIDDYAWVLLMLTGFVGSYFLRRKVVIFA